MGTDTRAADTSRQGTIRNKQEPSGTNRNHQEQTGKGNNKQTSG